MSARNLKSFARFLAVGSAALLIQVGAAAAANRGPDIQAQMRDVLSGNITAHAALQTKAGQHDASASGGDAQAFARRLLQGWSASAGAGTRPAQQARETASAPAKSQDIQALVRRQLLGV